MSLQIQSDPLGVDTRPPIRAPRIGLPAGANRLLRALRRSAAQVLPRTLHPDGPNRPGRVTRPHAAPAQGSDHA